MTPTPRRRLIPLALCAVLLGCASFPPRFPPAVAAGLNREPMRRLETPNLIVYYPASHRDVAQRISARLEDCVATLREKVRLPPRERKLDVFLTLANWNNGAVDAASFGQLRQLVIPIHATRELYAIHGYPSVEMGHVACHEAVHAVMVDQARGPWAMVNAVGGNVLAPTLGLERWFSEGLATYYEGRLGLRTGRPSSPWWNGMFHAAMATRDGGRPREGDVSIAQRDLYGTGAYLTSSFFIADLVDRYGEEKLWELIDRQSGSWLPLLAVPLRFEKVYGKPLWQLYAEFGERTAAASPARARPSGQRVVLDRLGMGARLAVSAQDGAVATITDGLDTPTRLTVRDSQQRVRFQLPLTEVLPLRRWIGVWDSSSVSGLSFSRDGARLYFTAWGTALDGDEEGTLWELDAGDGRVLRHWPIHGLGGDVTADDQGYVFATIDRDTSELARLDFATGKLTLLTQFGPLRPPGPPAVSPSGERIAFPLYNGETFDLAVREPDGELRLLAPANGFDYAPRWVDEDHLVWLRSVDLRWQLHVIDLRTGAISVQTDAPYLAFDSFPRGDELLFLNRDGVGFTLDSVPLRRPAASPPVAVLATDGPIATDASAPVAALASDASAPVAALATDGPIATEPSPPVGVLATDEASLPVAAVATNEPIATDASAPATPSTLGPRARPGQTELPPLPAALTPPLTIVSDEPYHPGSGLLRPFLHVPYVWTWPSTRGLEAGGGIAFRGADTLGFHNWELSASWDTIGRAPGFRATYLNHQLAPLAIRVNGSRVVTGGVETWQTGAWLQRSLWDIPVSLGFEYRNLRSDTARTILAGPQASISWRSSENTRYFEERRGVGLALYGALYPAGLSNRGTLGDLRAAGDFTVPLPFWARQALTVSVTGRALPGSADTPLLRLGGIALGGMPVFAVGTAESDPGPGAGELAFYEPLPGWEDAAISVERATIVAARWRGRVVIDRGLLPGLAIFPSIYFNDLNLELFGAQAFTSPAIDRRSVGASVNLRLLGGGFQSFWVTYRFAYRFAPDAPPLHLVLLGF